MEIEFLWTDRKRYFGMPISFTRYFLSADRLFVSSGFLTIRDDQLLLYRVSDINATRTFWQRFFGVGSVTVMSNDNSTPNVTLVNIRNPLYVKELIHRQVEECKKQNNVRVGEIVGDGFTGMPN
jgi:hypothetical protein